MPELTDRQQTIIRFLMDGYTDKEIAYDMGIAVVTVRKHIRRVIEKLKAKTKVHAVAIYLTAPTVGKRKPAAIQR